jgi:hypothetical protein
VSQAVETLDDLLRIISLAVPNDRMLEDAHPVRYRREMPLQS